LEAVNDSSTTFDFLNELEDNGNVLPPELVQEVQDFKADYDKFNGLLPSGTVPDLLGVSRQRWDQLREKYGFWSKTYFDKTWYSRQEIEDFYKVSRKAGRPSHDVAKVLKSILPALKEGE
jgi:hypothetical protein